MRVEKQMKIREELLGSASVGSTFFILRAFTLPRAAVCISRGAYCIGSRLLWSEESLVFGDFLRVMVK